jgi:hypothetical protein
MGEEEGGRRRRGGGGGGKEGGIAYVNERDFDAATVGSGLNGGQNTADNRIALQRRVAVGGGVEHAQRPLLQHDAPRMRLPLRGRVFLFGFKRVHVAQYCGAYLLVVASLGFRSGGGLPPRQLVR